MSVPRLVLQPGNPHDFENRELEALADDLRRVDPSLEVEIHSRPERGYGVTFVEVLNVVIDIVEHASTLGGAYAFFDIVVDWAKARWHRDREEHPESEPRPRAVTLYDHRGQPIKSVRVDAPEANLTEESAAPLPTAPPRHRQN